MDEMLQNTVLLSLRINGELKELEVPAHLNLLDLLREELKLTGTHMGCMTGHCGACTVMIDGKVTKSCLTLAATLERCEIKTIEGLMSKEGVLSKLQQAFWDEAGFQCGFCAPGMLLCANELLAQIDSPSEQEIEEALSGNLCRCTGYQSIKRAVKAAALAITDSKSE